LVRAVYPGTFDPVTNGHVDMVARASHVFDTLVVGVYRNPPKTVMFTAEERVGLLSEAVSSLRNVEVMEYTGLTVSLAHNTGASVIVRGLRIGADFEYEREMALMNRDIASDVDTVCLLSSLDYQFVSSSRVKEIAALGGDVSRLVPGHVLEPLLRKLGRG